jgi:3-oxoacyl-[acyl-carrier-protein] synthase-1
VGRTLAGWPDAGRSTVLVGANLNRDDYRSSTFWRSRLTIREPVRLDTLPTPYPPLSFGEIGAATGPVTAALLAAGWTRRYLTAKSALVCLLDDGGERGTLWMQAPAEASA